jgi:hypothetical protein
MPRAVRNNASAPWTAWLQGRPRLRADRAAPQGLWDAALMKLPSLLYSSLVELFQKSPTTGMTSDDPRMIVADPDGTVLWKGVAGMHGEHKEMAHDGWLRTIAWLGGQSVHGDPGVRGLRGAKGVKGASSASSAKSANSADSAGSVDGADGAVSGPPRSPATAVAPRAMARRTVNDGAGRPPARIHVLDRPTPRTAAISWSDPGVCHYGYQIWDMGPAKRTGVCVLSGSPIQVGDIVYCPREDEAPVNVGSMIAAAFVDA